MSSRGPSLAAAAQLQGPRRSRVRFSRPVIARCLRTRFRPQSVLYRPWMLRPPANWLVLMLNIIVTGGSRGLGLGIARKLTTAGYLVIAIARRESEQLASAMREMGHGQRGL